MLWLQTPPWGRWLLAGLIALVAVWVEFRPDPTAEYPFAAATIEAGEPVAEAPIEFRRLPVGLFETIDLEGVALRRIEAGEPLLPSAVGLEGQSIPEDWWIIELDLPGEPEPGRQVRLVLLDSGAVVTGVVASTASHDPFGSQVGSVAVAAGDAPAVAAAAAGGRVVVMVGAG